MRSSNARVRSALLATAVFLSAFAFSASAHAAGWGPDFRIGNGTTLNLATHINAKGDVTYIGAEQDVTDTTEIFSRVELGDSGRVTRHAITRFEDGEPVSAESGQDDDGKVSLLWSGPSGDPCGCGDPHALFVTRLDQNGSPLAQPLTVADYSSEDLHFSSTSYAVAGNGQAVVGATVIDPTTSDSWIEIFAISADFKSVTKITPNGFGPDADLIKISTNSSGEALAAWRSVDEDADTATIHIQRLTGSGPKGSATQLFSTAVVDQPLLVGTLLGEDGDGTVAFVPKESPSEQVMVVKSAANGSTLPPTTLEGVTTESLSGLLGLPQTASMALLPDGSALFAFVSIDGVGPGVRTFVVDRDGSQRSHEAVSGADNLNVIATALGLRPDGSGGLTYFQLYEDPDTSQATAALTYRPIDRNGVPTGPEEHLVTSDLNLGFVLYMNPQIALNSRGEIASSWTSLGFGAFVPSAHGRIYDGAAPIVSIKAPAVTLADNETVFVANVTDRNETMTKWSFGDGHTAIGVVQGHTFKSPGTYEIKVEATDSLGNVATATRQIRVVAESSGQPRARRAPNTRITRPPRLRLKAPRAVIRFASSQANSTFECRIGRGPIAGSRQARLRAQGRGSKGLVVRGKWRKCSSPLRLKRLRPAVYVVRVRAVGETRLRDRSPAVTRFRVSRPAKRR